MDPQTEENAANVPAEAPEGSNLVCRTAAVVLTGTQDDIYDHYNNRYD